MLLGELVGVVCIAAGVVCLLRAASTVRGDLVARLTLSPDASSAAREERLPAGRRGAIEQARRGPRSFDDEVAALNEQLGHNDG